MDNQTNSNAATNVAPLFIKSVNDLISFRDKVNNGEDFKDRQVIQLCPIEELKDWIPIGTMEHPFRGTYSGENGTFKSITVQTNGVAGLFGCIEGATIKNVCIESGSVTGNKVGGICGHIRFNGNIQRCENGATVKGVGEKAYAGGICGDSWGGTLTDCTNSGDIANESTSASALTAGIAGASYQGTIENGRNKGRIHPVGGHSGGICASNNKGTIRNSYNAGAVESGANKGSICGWNNGTIEKCISAIDMVPIGDGYPMDIDPVIQFALNEHCQGFAELKDNCWNYSIIARDSNADIFRNEYYAGYIQGKLQGVDTIIAARNNVWNNAHLLDTSAPADKFPHDFDPTKEELQTAGNCLLRNYTYLYKWVKVQSSKDNPIAVNIKRLLFRLLGINDGITYSVPQTDADFEKINPETMNHLKLQLGYRIQHPSFMDLYLINAQSDLFDALTSSKESHRGMYKADRCSAFVKRTADEKGNKDIYWTHNTWSGYLCQSLTINYAIGDDFVSQNCYSQGQVGSNMDFGFNGNGICFNETTHRNSYIKPKVEGIWICWRAAAAEMFARSIDDFYHYLSVDNTSTYLNGYMLIDANTNETALIEMSYKRFVMFRSDGNQLTVTDSTGVSDPDYDRELISAEYIFGVNYPISKDVAEDLQSTDNRPMRRLQFKEQIGSVNDMESAKELITYVGKDEKGNEEPLSIYGRWDLGRGTTQYPKTIPDGAVDAKVYSARKVKELLAGLRRTPNKNGGKTAFWMLYGTPKIDGKPFIWSESQWAEYKEKQDKDLVPDRLEGAWNETKLFMD